MSTRFALAIGLLLCAALGTICLLKWHGRRIRVPDLEPEESFALAPDPLPYPSGVSALANEGERANTYALSMVPTHRRNGQHGASIEPGQKVDLEWQSFKRGERDLVRLFLKAPTGVRAKMLFRHKTLNPGDTAIPVEDRQALRQLVRVFVRHLKETRREAAKVRHHELLRLEAAGELVKLTPELVGKEAWAWAEREVKRRGQYSVEGMLLMDAGRWIEGAAGFVMGSDGASVATANQLEKTMPYESYYEYQKQMFFNIVLMWFVAQGTMPEAALSGLSDRFAAALRH